MNPNLDIQKWCGEVEIRGDDLRDFVARLEVHWAVDNGQYYRGDFKLQADFPTVQGSGLVTIDLTEFVHESTIDDLLENYVFSE